MRSIPQLYHNHSAHLGLGKVFEFVIKQNASSVVNASCRLARSRFLLPTYGEFLFTHTLTCYYSSIGTICYKSWISLKGKKSCRLDEGPAKMMGLS